MIRKYKRLEQKTTRELIKVADLWWSRYVRLRDSELQTDGGWAGECIDGCGKMVKVYKDGMWDKASNVGHFISRGHHHLRFDEFNSNLQSAYCLTKESKMNMAHGIKKSVKDVVVGDKVMAFDEVSSEKTIATVLKTTKFKPATLIRVELEDGLIFTGTPDHRVFTTDGWQTLQDVLNNSVDVDILTL